MTEQLDVSVENADRVCDELWDYCRKRDYPPALILGAISLFLIKIFTSCGTGVVTPSQLAASFSEMLDRAMTHIERDQASEH